MTIDRETLMAYADGELDAVSARRVEKAMAAQPDLAEQVAAHRALRATLTHHFAPVIEAPLPDRLTALLDRKVVPLTPVGKARAFAQSGRFAALSAAAAALVIGIMLGQAVDFGPSSPVGMRQEALVAQGYLATALNTQLASAQSADSATRIGLTFRSRDGEVCRTFDSTALSGIACRAQGTWQLAHVIAQDRKKATPYRQAGSTEIMGAAQAMMAADPLDADQERKARDTGWK